MNNYTIISSKTSEDLAKKIAKKIKGQYLKAELRIFPDGESKITYSSKPKGTIVVVQSTQPPVDSNLVQALSLIFKAKQYSSKVIAVIPYLCYARQDKEFLPGEAITTKMIVKLFEVVGATKIIVVDVHSDLALKEFKIKATNVSAVPELVQYFKKLNLKNPLVVSPDTGGKDRAKQFSKLFGTDFIALIKKRDRKTGDIKVESAELKKITSRDIILIDDMISSGGSIIKASKLLKKHKCGKIFVGCTHALLIGNAEEKIIKAGVTKIVSTNTISGKTGLVNVSGQVVKAILKV